MCLQFLLIVQSLSVYYCVLQRLHLPATPTTAPSTLCRLLVLSTAQSEPSLSSTIQFSFELHSRVVVEYTWSRRRVGDSRSSRPKKGREIVKSTGHYVFVSTGALSRCRSDVILSSGRCDVSARWSVSHGLRCIGRVSHCVEDWEPLSYAAPAVSVWATQTKWSDHISFKSAVYCCGEHGR